MCHGAIRKIYNVLNSFQVFRGTTLKFGVQIKSILNRAKCNVLMKIREKQCVLDYFLVSDF